MSLHFIPKFNPSLLVYPNIIMDMSAKSCLSNYEFRLQKGTSPPIIEMRPFYCDRWSCLHCTLAKAERLKERIIHEARTHELKWHMTLTYDTSRDSSDSDPFVSIKKSWSIYRRFLQRKTNGELKYIWILGIDESGKPHFHILTNILFSKKDISISWEKRGGGPIVHTGSVWDLEKFADYLSCNLLVPGYSRGVRRFDRSKGIDLRINEIHNDWALARSIPTMKAIGQYYRVFHRKYDKRGALVYCRARFIPEAFRNN